MSSFSLGQIVCLRADPGRRGPIIEVLPPVAGRLRYRVFHSPTSQPIYLEEQLVLAAADDIEVADDPLAVVGAAPWVDAAQFRARLTAARLAHPLVDTLYALQAARIQYIPFQFKPILRLLRADQPRLLIADEVGVGKTIEAGLILKELQARQPIENVLIVCPKALVTKWQLEMRRFDEDSQILNADRLRHCLREADMEGAWPSQYARAIVHLELLRIDDYLLGAEGHQRRPGLATLDPPPRFSLLIVDEAHHLRNPGTSSHQLGQFLVEASEAVVFLSATPVHLGSRNLFILLQLLRPDLFPDEDVFRLMLEPNPCLTQAMRHVRTRSPVADWQQAAAEVLHSASETQWGHQVLARDPRFSAWRERLSGSEPLVDSERVRCLRDLEELHTLAHLMNRTRRRDIGRFTIREPHMVAVPFTPEQAAFYDALIAARREILGLTHDLRVVSLVTDTLERQAASCLPALVPLLDHVLGIGQLDFGSLTDDPEAEGADLPLPKPLAEQLRRLAELAVALPPDDPKLDQLLGIARTTLTGPGPGKLLVFSFFLHTLRYLAQQLTKRGYRVGLVAGWVEEEERQRLRDRFRLPRDHSEALDILLSSEVGCEGLDYEFCDRLVNYDIPWNPMRIEQRIGRIDRFGQQSDKVLIFNFVTPGTVEERIFYRCFERLGIFRDTIGDLEEILGDLQLVDGLLAIALDPTLTPAQAEEKARQLGDNALRLVDERRRLEEEGASLLGLDQSFLADVEAVTASGRVVLPADLKQMIGLFLERPGLGGRLGDDPERPGIARIRLNREARAGLLEQVHALGRRDRATTQVTRWLGGDEPQLEVTFEQPTALVMRALPFITPVHPLARVAVEAWSQAPGPLTAQLTIVDNAVPPGVCVFVLELWETISARPGIELVGLAWRAEERRIDPAVSEALPPLLARAAAATRDPLLPADIVAAARQPLDDGLVERRQAALVILYEENLVMIERKLASLDAFYRGRLERLEAESGRAVDARIRRMRQAERGRVELDYGRKRRQIEERRQADIISRRVAAGVLEIRHAERL